MSFSVGAKIGPYEIVERLGKGGMATVYKGYHVRLDRHVAIKVLHPTFKDDASFLRRFTRVAQVVARLEHPHIVPVYDFAEHEGYPYLVMRHIDGETLKERLSRGGMDKVEVLRIVKGIAQALDYAHRQRVLHRDVKPSNILLTSQGGVYIADFGLARITQAGGSTLSQDMMMGTPHYISPEQARGQENLDGRTDIYSFGIVLYEMLTGLEIENNAYLADIYYLQGIVYLEQDSQDQALAAFEQAAAHQPAEWLSARLDMLIRELPN